MEIIKKWYSVLKDKKTLAEGRVQTITTGRQGICLTHFLWNFIDNHSNWRS
jgi:pyruvate oxidase